MFVRLTSNLCQRKHQVLGRDVFVLETIRLLLSVIEDVLSVAAHAELRAGGAGQAVEVGLNLLLDLGDIVKLL